MFSFLVINEILILCKITYNIIIVKIVKIKEINFSFF